jgi:DNA-binding XRE family transcriptional regulator
MSASDAPATVGDELSRRMELGWTLEQVAEQVQVSAGILALIETGKRRPSLRSWQLCGGIVHG